ncbi:MAG: hypothetical protein IJ915_04680 [Paludibacteraceae bacterium]|nr:hypothetical protein [Paludibacteraceae bacterium]
MKKLFLLTALMAFTLSSHAVFYLTDSLSNLEDNKVWISTSKSEGPYQIFAGGNQRLGWGQIYQTNAGIELNTAEASSKATYKLGKKYSKLSFWLCSRALSDKSYSLVTITADGKRIYDEPYFGYDAPKWVVLDVTGVETLVFKLVDPQITVTFAKMQLWSAGETVVKHPIQSEPTGKKIKMVEEMYPYFMCGGTKAILDSIPVAEISTEQIVYQPGHAWWKRVDSLSIGRHEYKSGLQMELYEALIGTPYRYCFFWLGKKYDKISFIVGPRDNRSSNSSCWLVVKGDHGKILHESIVRQNDLPRQVVVDVSGQEIVNVGSELRDCDLLGGMTFGTVEMYAYPKGDATVPKEGVVNPNKEVIAKLPSPCPLMSSIRPYSVRGKGDADAVRFNGESRYKTFSMGGEKFNEGFILTTGTTFLGDGIDSYMAFDLAGEFDYISFYAGMLTKHRVLDDDRLLVFADDSLMLDTVIHCTWPNVYFEVPVNKCRILKFAKPGHKKNKECFIGVGDIALYRGKPVKHNLFTHVQPECPEEADLIDLCKQPYFHFVGRYLSTLTNFDFNDCFQNGETQRRFFQMKDGSKIYKGIMLEANMPLGIEDISLSDAVMMFFIGAGSAISSSDFSAYTGTSAGGGLAGQLGILHLMNNQNGGQASVVAFNPYGEYKTCTFSIANKSEYWDDVDYVMNLGKRVEHPFKLHVFADQRLVKTIECTNTMQPQTFTVPIYNCHQLMFWLEPGITRSGQFVLYDMTVSKKPYVPQKQCWEVTFEQGGTTQTVYGWLTEEEVLENIAEMRADSSVSNISYRPAEAGDKQACEELFDKSE